MNLEKIKLLTGRIAVIDNNVLTDLTEIGSLYLLNGVFSNTYIPQSILQKEVLEWQERALLEISYSPASVQTGQGYMHIRECLKLKPKLSPYDAEVIAIARENNWVCVSNEKRIMTLCEDFNIQATGTLGVIGSAYLNRNLGKQEFTDLIQMFFSESCSCYIGKKTQRAFIKAFDINVKI